MTDSGVQTRNISQTQKATLNSIRDLQRLENQLYKKLEQTTATQIHYKSSAHLSDV